MKKLISFLALAILVSSCNNQMSIVKRHYTKGFYVENSKKARHADVVKAETKIKNIEKMQPMVVGFLPETKIQDVEITASAVTAIKKEEKKNTFQAQIKKHFVETYKNLNPVKAEAKNNYSLKAEKVNKKSSGGSDTNLIVLVLLSLFPLLCLIAVYLHDGKEITNNFWVTLVLHLTVYLECIFAILVVLDIIDLK